VAVDALVAGGRDLGEDIWVAVHDTWEVHDFGNSDRPMPVEEPVSSAVENSAAGLSK